MDHASSIADRLHTLKKLHEQGIYTILFMSPIFPVLTDFKAIIEDTKEYIDEYWFENLNLRGSYKQTILSYIEHEYPTLLPLYKDIYQKGNKAYWIDLSIQIEEYCSLQQINYVNYFYHEDLVKAKLENAKKLKSLNTQL